VRRVATFHCVIESEDEEIVNRWLTAVAAALDRFAHQAAEICDGKVEIVEPMEGGQDIPVEGHGI